MRFVTEFLQVVGVKEWLTKEALTTHPHLFRIRPYFQPPVLSVEPAYERRIIRSQDQESYKAISDLPAGAGTRSSARIMMSLIVPLRHHPSQHGGSSGGAVSVTERSSSFFSLSALPVLISKAKRSVNFP